MMAGQRSAAEPSPLAMVLVRLCAVRERRLDADALGLVLLDGDVPVLSGGPELARDSLAAHVIAGGEPLFLADIGGQSRARRALAVPLTAGGRTVGALALERYGDIAREEREAACGLGAARGPARG